MIRTKDLLHIHTTFSYEEEERIEKKWRTKTEKGNVKLTSKSTGILRRIDRETVTNV